MIRLVSVIALIAVSATAVFAQSATIGQRKKLFKEMSKSGKIVAPMMKGEAKFDLAKVQETLKLYADNAAKVRVLFPDDSKKGGDTEATAAVWEKKAEFAAAFDKFVKDSNDAAAAIKDEASFKTEWPKVSANCGGCHKVFKVK
jgi:cytochrome c556